MKKISRFRDIPRFIHANWACDYEFHRAWEAIEKWQKEDGLNLDPDFQRAHVWKTSQQTAFMEYMLRGGMAGRDIYFNHPGWEADFEGEFVLVDGKQRLEALRRFFQNEIPAFGSLFKDFADSPRMCNAMFKFHVNKLRTRAEVLQWYIDLNSGVAHTSAEIERVRRMMKEER